jgi:hypothetical protein
LFCPVPVSFLLQWPCCPTDGSYTEEPRPHPRLPGDRNLHVRYHSYRHLHVFHCRSSLQHSLASMLSQVIQLLYLRICEPSMLTSTPASTASLDSSGVWSEVENGLAFQVNARGVVQSVMSSIRLRRHRAWRLLCTVVALKRPDRSLSGPLSDPGRCGDAIPVIVSLLIAGG